jgi:hypothetical protein
MPIINACEKLKLKIANKEEIIIREIIKIMTDRKYL